MTDKNRPPQAPDIDLDNREFQTALTLLERTSGSVFLTGKAGTGKSTFLKYITRTTSKKFVVLAPTGIAAINVDGQTLHSFFRLPFKPLLPDDPDFSTYKKLKKHLGLTPQRIKVIKEIELIIIDEISMVRADIIDFIDRLLRYVTGDRRRPFGGKQMLLVGDLFQLEPVVTADMRELLREWYPTPYFFNAKVFDEMDLVSVELTKVYRQNDRAFVEMLDRIRVGSPTPDDIRTINSRLFRGNATASSSDPTDLTMTLATRRDIVDNINAEHLEALKTPLRSYLGSVTGDFPESSFPTELNLTLKEGAQVVFVKNDPSHRWVNGTLGRVIEATDDEIRVELDNGSVYTVDREVWSNIRYGWDKEARRISEEVIGSFTQYPLKLAWALTIHKSQGLTFKRIRVDVGRGAFTGGQSYVALSRCTSLEGITMMSTLNERDIFVNPVVQKFSRTFNDEAAVDSALRTAKADALYAKAAADYDRHNYAEALKSLCWASGLRNDLSRPEIIRLLTAKVNKVIDGYETECRRLEAELAEQRLRLRQIADRYIEMGDDCRRDAFDPEAAVSNYDQALSLLPDHIEAMLGKAQALFAMSDGEGAVDLLRRATDYAPSDWRAPFELGRFFLACGDLSNALDSLLVAVGRGPDVPAIHESLAEIYDAADDPERAAFHRRAASKLRSKQQ